MNPKNKKHSPSRKKNGNFTAKLEVKFLDLYEIKIKQVDEKSSFMIQIENKKVPLGGSHLLGVNSNMTFVVLYLIKEGESTSLMQTPQQYLDADSNQGYHEEGTRTHSKSFFEINVDQMFRECIDSKQKVSKKRASFDQYVPFYQVLEKSVAAGQKFQEKKEVSGYIQVKCNIEINVKEEMHMMDD